MNNLDIDPTKLKFIIYARKSTEGEDRQVASLDDQLEFAEGLVKKNGYKVVKTFREAASASKPHNRPKFDQMVKMIEQGKANGIICWQTNRLARNFIESGIINQLLMDGKIQMITTSSQNYYPSSNAILLSVESGSSAQYSVDLKHNVRRGMHSKNKRGGWNHMTPQGYLNKHDENNQAIIVPDPKTFPLLKKMFTMFLTGNYTVSELLDIMNNDWGYRTTKHKHLGGKPLTLKILYAILGNPFYAGKIRDYDNKTVLHDGDWPAMITWKQYETIQRMKNENIEKYNRRPISYNKTKIRHELKGLLTCASCGCAIIGEHHDRLLANGTYNDHTYYKCTKKSPYRKCEMHGGIEEEEAFKQIDAIFDHYTIHPKLYEWAMEVLDEIRNKEITERYDVACAQNDSMKDCEKRLNTLIDMRTRELIDDEEFEAKAKELKKLKSELKQANQDAKERNKNWYEVIGNTLKNLVNPKERFNATNEPSIRRSLLLAIGPRPVLKEVPLGTKDYGGRTIPTHHRALTAKKIEVEPYRWLKELDETPDQDGKIFSLGALTEKMTSQQGSNEQLKALQDIWWAKRDLNPHSIARTRF